MANRDIVARSLAAVWHPCTQMKQHERFPLVPVARGEGPWLHDFDGRRYLDAVSSWWVNLFGHAHPAINAALREQLDSLEHVMLAGFTHAPAIELAERLARLAPGRLGHAFFASDGASAAEIALKMAFHFHANRGDARRTRFVSLQGGYHGETLGALGVTDVPAFRAAYAPLLRESLVAPFPARSADDHRFGGIKGAIHAADELGKLLAAHAGEVAAFIVEPLVQGASGMRFCHPEYLRRARELCTRHGVVLIADEIMTGFGRTGTMFACEQAGIAPDLMCLSKGISGGYLPLSCVLATDDVYGTFYDDDTARGFLHSHSYSGNALACRAACAVLDIFEREDVIAANERKAARFFAAAAPLAHHAGVRDFRHLGMIWAFEVATRDPAFASRAFALALERGVLLRPIGNTVYFMPPYVIDDAQFALLVDAGLAIVDAFRRGMMRRILALLVLLPLAALARELPAPVRSALARANVPLAAVGALVAPVEGGVARVAHQAEEAFNPASVMKLVTSYAALDILGPAFTFRTEVLAEGEIAGGVLAGDLVIRGGGDPKLTYERVWQIAHRLRARGLREIRGDIVVDRGYFARVPHDPARFDNDPRRSYNVGADALLVNFQSVQFNFIPEGDGVRVTGEPDLPNVEIASRIKAVKGACGWWRGDLQHDFVENGLIATVVFSGSYPVECGEKSWSLALFDAPRFAESVLRWVWSEAGGVLRGKVRTGTAGAGARLIYRHESEPLSSLVRDMNKFSNNVMARHLFLALSAQRGGGAGDYQASEHVAKEWLHAKGVAAPELVIDNGAGLSREARASAATLAAVLRGAWASPVMPEMMASLPVFGVDGTLKSRLSAGASGRAHLKGGTLTGVQAMAGYVLDRRGRRWVVVMMVNHSNANAAQPALDALVEWVYAR